MAASIGMMACVGTSAVPPEAPPLAPQQVVATAPAVTAAAATAPKPMAIDALNGTWQALRLASSDHAWHHTYRFADGQYRVTGYPSWEESGRMDVLAAEPRRLRVRFSERVYDGQQEEPRDTWIELDTTGETALVRIDGDAYERKMDATVAADEAAPGWAAPAAGE